MNRKSTLNTEDRSSRFYTYIKPILRNQAVRDYAPLVFSLITSAIFAYFAIKPTLSTIVSLQKTLEEQKQTLAQIDQKTNDLTLARKNHQEISPKGLDNLSNMVPPSPDLPYIIDNLNYLASINQATISGLQFQPLDLGGAQSSASAKASNFGQIDFTVNAQGPYENLTQFLDSLGKASRLIEVRSVTFTKGETGPLLMSVSAKAFYTKN